MAEVIITFDTKTKAMTATMDGEQIPDVCGIYMSCCYEGEKMRCEIMQCAEDEENDTRTYTRICASENGVSRNEVRAESGDVGDDIAAYFGSRE
jgi:hypothetical protein